MDGRCDNAIFFFFAFFGRIQRMIHIFTLLVGRRHFYFLIKYHGNRILQRSKSWMWKTELWIKKFVLQWQIALNMALFTQNTYHNNDYISVARLVDAWFFYKVKRWTIIYILGGWYKYVKYMQPFSLPDLNIIVLSISHLYTS